MSTNEDPETLTLENNPGLEHQHATPEGELMTAEGSRIRDPNADDEDVTLDKDPGLEHDETTEAESIMTAEGSPGPEDDPD